MALPDRNWQNMTEAQLKAADCSDWIAVLPLGAHEQHGPHLPLDTDSIIAGGIANRLVSNIRPEIPVTFLPVEPVGYSVEHMDFSGSKTLAYNEAIERWISIGQNVSGFGIKKLVLLNAHGGNSPLMTVVATELRVRLGMLCVATSWTRFLEPGSYLSSNEKKFGIHGGEIETSVMLALCPDQVVMDQASNFPSLQETLANQYRYLRAYGPHAFGWKMGDLNKDGVAGNAAQATADKGETFLSQAVDGITTLLEEVHDFDLSSLRG